MKVASLLSLATASFQQKFRETCSEDSLSGPTPDFFAHRVGTGCGAGTNGCITPKVPATL